MNNQESIRSDIEGSLEAWLKTNGDSLRGVARIYGGRNNRGWRVESGSNTYFLKEYFRHPQDTRDRLGAEFAFLQFCQDCGITGVPQPILRNDAAGFAVYSYVAGEPVTNEIGVDEVRMAANFVRRLAVNSSSHVSLSYAADACLCIEDHFRLADRKIKNLLNALCSQPLEGITGEAAFFVKNELEPVWKHVEREARGKIASGDFMPAAPRLFVSPSDFGFHNALKTSNGIVFVDFEYAGMDDPVKMLCDFFCQPQLPVPEKYMSLMAESLTGFDRDNIIELTRIWLPIHRIKWCCIILNDFLRTPAMRRDFSDAENCSERLNLQLMKAKEYIKICCQIGE